MAALTRDVYESYAEFFRRDSFLKFLLYLTLFGYFYNLGVVEFNITGDNPIRIYDFTGFFLILYFLKYVKYISLFSLSVPYTKWLYYFILWSFLMMFVTIFYYLLVKQNLIHIIQTLIYFFHMLLYFVVYVFFLHILSDPAEYKRFLYFFLFLVIGEGILVILQYFGIVDFLWGQRRWFMYRGYLSGTLGPNRVVLGMTMFMSFVVSYTLMSKKIVKINRFVLASAMTLSAILIISSGSRTSYIAFLIFFTYILFFAPGKTLKNLIWLSVFFMIMSWNYRDVINTAIETFKRRVMNKVSYETVEERDVVQLYDELGSGRLDLTLLYLEIFAKNPYAIPFGTGFNNRMLHRTSAHNMYLNIIKELGLVGFFLYFTWLYSYLFVRKKKRGLHIFKVTLHGLVLAMAITLFFGEHLYIFRPLYALWGLFLFVTAVLLAPLHFWKTEEEY